MQEAEGWEEEWRTSDGINPINNNNLLHVPNLVSYSYWNLSTARNSPWLLFNIIY